MLETEKKLTEDQVDLAKFVKEVYLVQLLLEYAKVNQLFSGDYNDLSNKPNISNFFSGDYNDLTNKPNLYTKNYKSCMFRMVQSGTSNPITSIIDNDLGENPVWTRQSVGVYRATFSEQLNEGKIIAIPTIYQNSSSNIKIKFSSVAKTYVEISTHNPSTDALSDSNMGICFLEIRIYN
jgi:hypothetical protein